MPARARSPMFDVPEPDVDPIMQEIMVRVSAKKRVKSRVFDPALGATWEEAEEKLQDMRADVGKYGEYVYGLAPADIHRDWNRIANDIIYRRIPQNKLLIIAPPNSAKSTWNSLIRTSYHLGKHPDQNILFFTASDPMAKVFHSPIASCLEENERHRYVFPDALARPHKKRGWSTDGLYLRGVPAAMKDPSFKAVGFNANIMGARARGIIVDDPLDQDEAESDTVQKKAKGYLDKTIIPRLEIPDGWMLAHMTRFHENDLASHMIELAQKSGDWLVKVYPLVATNEPVPDPLGRMTGQVLWPEKFTEVFVQQTMARFTIAEFNLVYQGDPTGIGGDIFQEEGWFQDLPANFWSDIYPNCHILQGYDLAFSEKKTACFSVGMTIAVDSMLNIYIINVMRKRYTIGRLEDLVVKSAKIAKPLILGMETDRFHQALTKSLANRILGRVMVNIQLIRPTDDKVARARLPAGRAEAGKVFINKNQPWHRPFISECLGFPNTKYKDQVDTFSLVTAMVDQIGQLQKHQEKYSEVQTALS